MAGFDRLVHFADIACQQPLFPLRSIGPMLAGNIAKARLIPI
jgi:hypothetical protein